MNHHFIRTIALVGGPLAAFLIILLTDLSEGHPEVTMTAGIAVWMAIWWITEAVPLAITSLLPVVLFPVFGVMNGKEVAGQYFNHIIFLFLGGFMVALAMEKWNLHKRIALRTLMLFGGKPQRILLGFMIATAFLSMWISNTATTMMMVPIVLAIVVQMEVDLGKKTVSRYSIAGLLGVAYSASIGGIATLVGTPPNLSFTRIFEIQLPEAPEISFAQWFLFAIPISIVMLFITWGLLSILFLHRSGNVKLRSDASVILGQYRDLGPMSFEEIIVLFDFVLLALLWLTRAGIDFGEIDIPGWSALFENPKYLNDGVVAVSMAILLFMIPARKKESQSNNIETILDWETCARIPWNIILLFGGGFALAKGFKVSGLDAWAGEQLQGVGELHPALIVAIICLLITHLTELTSNTATTEMILPVLAGLSKAIAIHPLLLMIPATLSCSCAFMLPVATPPNAIVFGTQRLRILTMAKTGILLNLIGVLVITAGMWVWGRYVFDIDLNEQPAWVEEVEEAPQ